MYLKMLFAVCLMCFSIGAIAQDYAFKVLVNKGQNEVKSEGKWQAVKTGTTLKSTDELKVGDNAYLGLIHANGRPLELRTSDTYKVAELSAKMGTGSTVLNKYTDFILSSNSEKRSNLTATGAVHRGPYSVKMFLPAPEHSYVFNDSVTLNWSSEKVKGPYIVVFSNFFSEELARFETANDFVTVNLGGEQFNGENDIQVQVITAEGRKASDEYIIRKLSVSNRERVDGLRSEFRKDVLKESALAKLLEAGFYEQNKLFIDAATALLKAAALAPDVALYKEEYEHFLTRNGLKTQ